MNPMIIIEVSKDEIVNKKLFKIKQLMNDLLKNLNENYKSVHILFGGYDDVPEEIYEIKEIRDFCDAMVKKYPHIFYFLEDTFEGQQNILLCISDYMTVSEMNKKTLKELYDEDPESFVERHADIPRNEIRLMLPRKKFEKILSGLVKFGLEEGVMSNVESVMNDIGNYVVNE